MRSLPRPGVASARRDPGPTVGTAESGAEKRAGPRSRPGILGLPGKPAGPIVGSQASACRCHGAGAGAGASQVRWGRLGSQGLRGGRGRGLFIGATTPPPLGMLRFPRQGLQKAPGVPWDLCLPPVRPAPFVQREAWCILAPLVCPLLHRPCHWGRPRGEVFFVCWWCLVPFRRRRSKARWVLCLQ